MKRNRNNPDSPRPEESKALSTATGFVSATSIALGIAVFPVVALLIAAMIGLLFVLLALVIYLLGGIVWLISGDTVNPFSFANLLFEIAGKLFGFLVPISNFCFAYITPYVSWVAVVLGLVGAVVAMVALSGESKKHREYKNNAEEIKSQEEAEYQALVAANPGKKVLAPKQRRRTRSSRGRCVACIVVCILFAVIAAVCALIAPHIAASF